MKYETSRYHASPDFVLRVLALKRDPTECECDKSMQKDTQKSRKSDICVKKKVKQCVKLSADTKGPLDHSVYNGCNINEQVKLFI